MKVASGLPVKSHLWGAVDVYGKCTKIKSELLSGKWIVIYLCYVWQFIQKTQLLPISDM